MKACVKAWQEVINPQTRAIYDEIGLKALDALRYGPVREIEVITEKNRKEMIAEFEKKHPDFRYDFLEIVTDENS